MDSHAVSYTTPSRRNSSRTYQDLATYHTNGHSTQFLSSYIMEEAIKHRTLRPATPPHIGIVGAGISGLRCADILLQNGFQVTILEGRDRVGGRVYQTHIPNTDHLVDIGANWIHGTDHNPILDLAKQTKTTTHSWGENFNVFDEDGNHMSPDDGAEYNEIMWGVIIDAFKHSNEDFASIPPTESLYDFFVGKAKELIPDTENDFEKRRGVLFQMAEMWGAFVGRTVKEQSLKFFWLEETIEGENLFCAGTYQKILALIAKPALEKAKIKLSTKVSKICTADRTSGKLAATTDAGEALQFDEMVMTAPLGWLKQNREAFSPPLPPRLCSAIESIGYGCLEKVYISFPRAFWLSTPKEKTQKGQPDSTQPDPDPEFSGFSQFLSPTYSPLNPDRWIQEMLELGTLPPSTAHPTLLYYIFGAQSHALAASLRRLPPPSSPAGAEQRHSLLVAFFYPYFSRLPHFSAADPACVPSASYATEWLNDELAGNGSYSNFPTGLEEGDRDIEIMRQGLPGRGLWFAGEHTAPFVASGTVTGAYWSGERVGRRIAEAYGMVTAGEEVGVGTVEMGAGTAETGGGGGEDRVGNGVESEVADKGLSDQEVNVRAFTDLKLEK